MKATVLFVDDEPLVLDGIRRQIRSRAHVLTAESGAQGLEVLESTPDLAVIVSDMRMPGMDGAEFLARVRELRPDPVRMILSGQSDLEMAIAAVNDAQISRFLTKPCSPEQLWEAVSDGIRQYELLNIEKTLLEDTLSGAVRMMNDFLTLSSSVASERSERIQALALRLVSQMGYGQDWEFRMAAMLSQVGCVTVPECALEKLARREALSDEEQELYTAHTSIASRLIRNIPRLETVAEMIERQSGPMRKAAPSSERAALGGWILQIAVMVDDAMVAGQNLESATRACVAQLPALPARLKIAAEELGNSDLQWSSRKVAIDDLDAGMVLAEDIVTTSGMCLLAKGMMLKSVHIARLQAAVRTLANPGPISILQHATDETTEAA